MSQSKTKTKPHPSDEEIVELYFARDEQAIAETDKKYGKVCMQVSMNIVESRPDAEECVSDGYLKTWHSIPPPVRPPSAPLSAALSATSPSIACGT